MKKGLKIVLGIVSVMILLSVGFTAGAVFTYVVYSTDINDVEAIDDVSSEDIALKEIPPDDVPLGDVPLDDLALENMDIYECLDYFEENEYPVVWPVLWIVTTNIDADGTYEDVPVHANIQMPQKEQNFFMSDVPDSFERTVEEFTNGLVDIQLTKILYTTPITYLVEDYNCLDPESFDEDMQATFLDYNTVICTARYSEPYEEIYSQDWLGLANVMDEVTYGFCQIASNWEYDESIFKASEMNPYEAEPWIHEWIHTLEPFCEILGNIIPSPDSAETYGYECMNPEGINGFYDYYHDTITASVWDASQGMYTGITPAMWRTMAYYYDQIR